MIKGMIKKWSVVYMVLFLTSCTTEGVRPVSPRLLPPVAQPTLPLHSVSTLEEWVKTQPLVERKALLNFMQTHKTPVIETSQFIQFPFGRITPQINCSPLHTCDITLQCGEKVTGVYPGDTARWLFEEAVSGEQQMHVVFKPKESNIATNTIITTTQRTYYINLISKDNAISKAVLFYYPDDFLQSWKNAKDAAKALIQEKQSEQSLNTDTFNHLNFNYQMNSPLFDAKPRWMPERVFNNGKQVYIQMPPASETIPLPALFILGKGDEPELVNYRVRKPYYIVDQIFQKAILISGVGRNQQRVTITYQDE
jgi:type IV secretion system protein VirB9